MAKKSFERRLLDYGLNAEEVEQLMYVALEVQAHLKHIYAQWRTPVKYSDLLQRYTFRMVKQLPLGIYADLLHESGYIFIMHSPAGGRYLYPLSAVCQQGIEALASEVLQLDQITRTAKNTRRRKQ